MRKLVLFAAILAILGAYGCNEDNVYNPDVNADGRVIGTIQGTVADGADATLLSGVECTTTVRGEHVTVLTDAVGHYSFTNLDPGDYLITFVFPETGDKGRQAAYTTVTGDAYIPTLVELTTVGSEYYDEAIDYVHPTDRDFHYEVEGPVNMFPLIGGAEGDVKVQTDEQTLVPAEGVGVVAYFDYPVGLQTEIWELTISDNEWSTTTDEAGHYSFTGLPTGTDGKLRTLAYTYGGANFEPLQTDLNLEGGGTALPEDMVFDATTPVEVLWQNWNSGIPFPVASSFEAIFSVPMEPSTFVATLNDYGPVKTLLPVTWTWSDNKVTIDPENDLLLNHSYTLTMAGWSTDGQAFTMHSYTVNTGAAVPPSVIATNFEDSRTFPIDGDLTFTFNMAMDPDRMEVRFDYDKIGDIVFDPTWNESNTVLTINPAVDLDYNTHYLVKVEGYSNSGVAFPPTTYTFRTRRLQDVIVTNTNFMEDFDNTADLFFDFSEAMDPGMTIVMYRGTSANAANRIGFDKNWPSNTHLVLNPTNDLDLGQDYLVTMDGMAVGGQDFSYSRHYKTMIGDAPFVISTNVVPHVPGVPGVFPVTGENKKITIVFNKAMDQESVDYTFRGASNPLYGVITWSSDTALEFVPNADLLPSTLYTFGLTGKSQDGGTLNYSVQFDTIGGIMMVWNNVQHLDGTPITQFPVDGTMQFTFNLPVNPDAVGTMITLTRNFTPPVEVLFNYSLSTDGMTLTITPDQTMEYNTPYTITYLVGSFYLADTTSGTYTFTTEPHATNPTSIVTNFAQDPDNAWAGDFDTKTVKFQWDWDANATEYFIYARNVSGDKDDYLRVATVTNPAADPAHPDDQTVTATVNLAGTPTFVTYFDSRTAGGPPYEYNDHVQTPFEGGKAVAFNITAYNSLGESAKDSDLELYDVFGPDGSFTGQDVSADDSAAPTTDGIIVNVTFDASEYLDHSVVPEVTITENDLSVNNWGDPAYVGTLGTPTMEDMDGHTRITVPVMIDEGMNGAGDYVAIDGFKDTSGNEIDAATVIAPYQLMDTTKPTGAFEAWTASLDNSGSATPLDFTVTFNASELLDDTVDLSVGHVSVVDNAPVGDSMVYVGTFTIVDDVVTLDMQVPAHMNAVGDQISLNGLVDLAGNTQTVAVLSDPAIDTTAPTGVWGAADDDSQNKAIATFHIAFTSWELLDESVAPTITIKDVGQFVGQMPTYVPPAVYSTVGNQSVVTCTFTLADTPAGFNAVGDIININGLTDTSGNAQTVGIDSDPLVDTTPPIPAPAGLAVTSANGDNATGVFDVVLTWTDANDIQDLASYEVFRDGATSVGVVLAGATRTVTDHLTVEVSGNTHTYTIYATDTSANVSAASGGVLATLVDNVAPAVTADLAVTSANGDDATGNYAVVLTWTGNTETDMTTPSVGSYDIYRDGVFLANVLHSAAHTYTDNLTGALAGQTKSYTILSKDGTGNASAQSAAVVATLVDNVPPAVPTGLAVVTANGDDATGVYVVNLSWTASSESDLQDYQVFRDGTLINTVLTPLHGFTETLTGELAGHTHDYTITARDNVQASAQTAPVTATLVDNVAPAAPTNVAITSAFGDDDSGDYDIIVTWTPSVTADVATYLVKVDGATNGSIVTPPYTAHVTGLFAGNGTSHLVSVQAADAQLPTPNYSGEANINATLVDNVAPTAPTLAVGTTNGDDATGNFTVNLTWTDGSTDYASVELFRNAVSIGVHTSPYADPITGALDGQSFTYTAQATDNAGNIGGFSVGAPATLVDNVGPTVASTLSVAATTNGDDDDATGYYIALTMAGGPTDVSTTVRLYRQINGGGYTDLGLVTMPYTDHMSNNAPDVFQYYGTTQDTHGNVATVNTNTATTTLADNAGPNPVTVLTLIDNGGGSMTINWTPGSETDGNHYVVYANTAPGSALAGVASAPVPFGTGTLTNNFAANTTYNVNVVAYDNAGNVSAVYADQSIAMGP